jgi:ankyrin repeat protein
MMGNAIIIAAFVGQPEYVKRLRTAGAKMDGFVAAALGDRKLVEKTLRQRPEFAEERDTGGLTALQCAAGSRYPSMELLDIAHLLLDAGADVEAKTLSWNHEIDALYFAASAKNKSIFELLLRRGGDATEALVHALWGAGEDFAELAVAHGGDPDCAVTDGKPLLNHLICWGRVSPALWLLERGASPNIADGNGWTAVHQAASRGNERMLRAVLEAGGDLTQRDNQGFIPFDIAKTAGRSKLMPLLSPSTHHPLQ